MSNSSASVSSSTYSISNNRLVLPSRPPDFLDNNIAFNSFHRIDHLYPAVTVPCISKVTTILLANLYLPLFLPAIIHQPDHTRPVVCLNLRMNVNPMKPM